MLWNTKIKVKNVKMNNKFEWKKDFETGNEQLDNEHRQLFKQINKLYKMFSDTKKYHAQIPEMIKLLEFTMIEHFEIENELLKNHSIFAGEEHIQEHNRIKESIYEIKNYNLPTIITALMLCDIIINYFLKHFQDFDKKFISELNEKLEIESKIH